MAIVRLTGPMLLCICDKYQGLISCLDKFMKGEHVNHHISLVSRMKQSSMYLCDLDIEIP